MTSEIYIGCILGMTGQGWTERTHLVSVPQATGWNRRRRYYLTLTAITCLLLVVASEGTWCLEKAPL